MRTFICCLSLLAWTWLNHANAQERIEKNIPTNNAEVINFDFHHADVSISSWDKKEIQVLGTININDNKENDKFELTINSTNNKIDVVSKIKNLNKKNINNYVVITKNCCSDKNCHAKKHSNFNSYMLDVRLEIKIPKDLALNIKATYGDLTLDVLNTALNVENTYGGITASLRASTFPEKIQLQSHYSFVDLGLPRSTNAAIELHSKFGEIYTNLDIKIQAKSEMKALRTTIVEGNLNGGGQAILAKAKHDNIYLRALE